MTSHGENDTTTLNGQNIEADTVLILGGGPVGVMTAAVLAKHGVKSVVLERNLEPTKWPKMDLTNARSMELLRKIGLADRLRSLGVPSDIQYTVLMSTGLSRRSALARWDLPSVNEYEATITAKNDGTQPLEPYQRIPQYEFETMMREESERNPLIDLRYGCKLESIRESPDGVEAVVVDDGKPQKQLYKSRFAVACDGASSRCRKDLGIGLEGGPTPFSFLLIHFRTSDVEKIRSQGRFWHLFVMKHGAFGGAVISQDEKETFTVHYPLPPGSDGSEISSEDAIFSVLGGMYEPYTIKIDEILVRSTFRPSIAVANEFSGLNLRLFLAGDAAHQNIPTGGYGLNTGIGDAYDIAWKLAAVIKGYGGPGLLKSYEQERKPVAHRNVQRSGVHMGAHLKAVELMAGKESLIDSDSEEAEALRKVIVDHYLENSGENTDLGIEMGYRYESPIVLTQPSETQPAWDPHEYLPTTWPGSRAPHVFLADSSSILDHLGDGFSLVEFDDGSSPTRGSQFLVEAAQAQTVPLLHLKLRLPEEKAVVEVWERPLVLVRPDGHVAWRGELIADSHEASLILHKVTGH